MAEGLGPGQHCQAGAVSLASGRQAELRQLSWVTPSRLVLSLSHLSLKGDQSPGSAVSRPFAEGPGWISVALPLFTGAWGCLMGHAGCGGSHTLSAP